MTSLMTAVGLMLLCALWTAHDVSAEHTMDHRYTIWGYVKDADGAPLKGTLVAVTDGRETRLGVARSGANGRYSIRLHLHNSDIGRLLGVEANNVSRQFRVTFSPNNITSVRTHRVDFLGRQAVEILRPDRSLTTYILLAIGAAAVIIPAFLYVTGRVKRKRRPKGSARRRQGPAKAPARRRPRKKK